MGEEAGWAPSGGLRSCACSRTGWGRHHHHHGGADDDYVVDIEDVVYEDVDIDKNDDVVECDDDHENDASDHIHDIDNDGD